MRSRFAIIGRSVAGRQYVTQATRWLPALSLTFINPASVVLGYGFPGVAVVRQVAKLIFDKVLGNWPS
jgi:hypothetical protein